MTAKRVPEAPARGWSGGHGRLGRTGGGTVIPHPPGPVGLALPASLGMTSECRLLANKGEINVNIP